MDPVWAVEAYLSRGYDFIALTDHDYLLRDGCYDCIPNLEPHFIVFRGIERTIFHRGYVHMNHIYGVEEEFCFLNHPADYQLREADLPVLLETLAASYPLGGIEVTTHGYYTPEFDREEIALVKLATDDAHQPSDVGRAWVEVLAERDKDSILRSLRAGKVRLGFRR